MRRGFGIGLGQHPLRFGFEHNRFLDDLVFMGNFPRDPERITRDLESTLTDQVPYPIEDPFVLK